MTVPQRVWVPLLWVALVAPPVRAGQAAGEIAIAVRAGNAAGSARLVDGRWAGAAACRAAAGAPGGGDGFALAGPARLSVTGGASVAPVRMVRPGAEEWLRVQPVVLDLFDRRERAERVSVAASDGTRAMDWLYAADEPGRRWYYFEVSRRVAGVAAAADADDDVDPPGTLRVAVAGFLDDAGGRLRAVGTKSELRWEQDGLPAGPAVADLTPLGIVAHGGRAIWVMQGRSGARAWFTLYDVAAAGTRTLLARQDIC